MNTTVTGATNAMWATCPKCYCTPCNCGYQPPTWTVSTTGYNSCNANTHMFACDHVTVCKCGKASRTPPPPPKCLHCGA